MQHPDALELRRPDSWKPEIKSSLLQTDCAALFPEGVTRYSVSQAICFHNGVFSPEGVGAGSQK